MEGKTRPMKQSVESVSDPEGAWIRRNSRGFTAESTFSRVLGKPVRVSVSTMFESWKGMSRTIAQI